MSQTLPNTSHLAAAAMIARDVPIREIARQFGVTPRTIYTWAKTKEAQERIAAVKAGVSEATKHLAIADKARRIETLDTLHSKLLTVVDERAVDMTGEVAGGGTGLMARQVKQMGRSTVTEYVVDSGVVREIRGLEEQAAKELGDWIEKSAIDGGIDVTTTVQIVGIDADLL
jgi:transposase-like protein